MAGLPTGGITMGDAAGIGPEVVVKALADLAGKNQFQIKVIGDAAVLERTARNLGLEKALGLTHVIDLRNVPSGAEIGVDAAGTGKASAEFIVKAVEMWRAGDIDAISTAPISKKAIALGGYDFPGHTEFLANLTGTERFAMSFFAGKLRVALLSTHVSLRDAIELVRSGPIADLITFSNEQFERLLRRKVKLAVAGLNPHASEGGMFGREEQDEIIPAVESCRRAGIDVAGPFSPDTIFLRCASGEFDAVIPLYHYQATIRVK